MFLMTSPLAAKKTLTYWGNSPMGLVCEGNLGQAMVTDNVQSTLIELGSANWYDPECMQALNSNEIINTGHPAIDDGVIARVPTELERTMHQFSEELASWGKVQSEGGQSQCSICPGWVSDMNENRLLGEILDAVEMTNIGLARIVQGHFDC